MTWATIEKAPAELTERIVEIRRTLLVGQSCTRATLMENGDRFALVFDADIDSPGCLWMKLPPIPREGS